MTDRRTRDLPTRSNTARAALEEELRKGSASAKDLSSLVGISERDVAAHLEHLERSVRARGARLHVEPARCLACEYVFRERARKTTPGACPACRSERVAPPTFRVEERPRG